MDELQRFELVMDGELELWRIGFAKTRLKWPRYSGKSLVQQRRDTMFRASLAYGPNSHTQGIILRLGEYSSPVAAWDHLRAILDAELAEPVSVMGSREELVALRKKMAKRFKRGHAEIGNLVARVY